MKNKKDKTIADYIVYFIFFILILIILYYLKQISVLKKELNTDQSNEIITEIKQKEKVTPIQFNQNKETTNYKVENNNEYIEESIYSSINDLELLPPIALFSTTTLSVSYVCA